MFVKRRAWTFQTSLSTSQSTNQIQTSEIPRSNKYFVIIHVVPLVWGNYYAIPRKATFAWKTPKLTVGKNIPLEKQQNAPEESEDIDFG